MFSQSSKPSQFTIHLSPGTSHIWFDHVGLLRKLVRLANHWLLSMKENVVSISITDLTYMPYLEIQPTLQSVKWSARIHIPMSVLQMGKPFTTCAFFRKWAFILLSKNTSTFLVFCCRKPASLGSISMSTVIHLMRRSATLLYQVVDLSNSYRVVFFTVPP